MKEDLPEELKNLGIEYLMVTKEAKEKGISPSELKKIIEAVSSIMSERHYTVLYNLIQ